MKIKYLNEEQKHQIEIYKWLRSEQVGHDIGEQGCLEWVKANAECFREWAENLPSHCIECGLTGCQGADIDGDCPHPFCIPRLNLLRKNFPTSL